ncbi:hypothetical protein SAMN05192546_106138 [Tindallia californiensis]|uniref:Uncharacterized protein n=1 Tax=Tindallia californiensis TaxID=159292 RepID=A0A1H3PCY3_9FIRM|nr:hypothetical protein SAMN05192546_106138 [Tindallia californiensis]
MEDQSVHYKMDLEINKASFINYTRFRLIIFFLLTLFIIGRFWGYSQIIVDSVMKDQWYFLRSLASYYESGFSLQGLMEPTSHLKIGYMLVFLVNAIFLI